MSGLDGKLDVLELARAQLDFAAVNAGAPPVREVMLKAQTIVPLAPQVQWERLGKGAGAALLAAAAIALPWVPQQTLFSIAAVQFEQSLDTTEAQEMVNRAVLQMPGVGRQVTLSATYVPHDSGGLLQVRAAAVGERSGVLQSKLQGLYAADGAGGAAAYPVAEFKQNHQASPLQLAGAWFKERYGNRQQDAEVLAAGLARTTPLLRSELSSDLLKHGYQLSAFAFSDSPQSLPHGTHFPIEAWPRNVAVGIKGYTGLTPFQQREARELAAAWLKRMGLREQALQLPAGRGTQALPVTVEVIDVNGRFDPVQSARLMARLVQPAPQDLTDINFDPDPVIAKAAAAALPDVPRRVEYERTTLTSQPARFKARVYLLRGDAPATERSRRADPVDDSAVREEW